MGSDGIIIISIPIHSFFFITLYHALSNTFRERLIDQK